MVPCHARFQTGVGTATLFMQKLIVILGATATGKSDAAVKIAKKFGGEIISADSRQVYRDLDIGTGKITEKEMLGVPHHMLDVVSPKKIFSAAKWQEQTKKIILEISAREKLPIICGGTGFYIQTVVQNLALPEVPPNKKLRDKLKNKTAGRLVEILQKFDPEKLKTIDRKNPVRLIRAIEIAAALGAVPKLRKNKNDYDILQIGLKLPDEILKKRIYDRLIFRIKKGMIGEVKKLRLGGLSWKRLNELGLEYRYLAWFLRKKISRDEFVRKLNTEIWHYARRQKQWWKSDKKIKWFSPNEIVGIEKEVEKFLKT
jgi:tRNA dimethylallyltransferase